ncbi:hypothetical protein EV182_001661 [Spiromyces aspiralis]|uniref:Uncharacterized protein n=1 Tax=Spiromyces aspiralis TaxID=68401 RepID=A0ACC1HJ31_9FUNG|nr:hypothetical protein EV182_001661 [Spiromyces aspiralis]
MRIKSRVHIESSQDVRPLQHFKAKPVDPKVLEGPKVAPKKKATLTIPKSPKLHKTKVRSASSMSSAATQTDENRQFKARPVPRGTEKPFAPSLQHAHTEAHPFRFKTDEIIEARMVKFREEIERMQQEQEKKRRFRAQPMPSFSPKPSQSEKIKQQKQRPLEVEPFELLTDKRGEEYRQQLMARLEELEQRRRERAQFKARGIPASLDHPFVPQPSDRLPTQVEEVIMHTELRSEEREAWGEERREREMIRQEVLRRRQFEEELREQEEIRLLRAALVHKPEPIRKYKKVEIKPSARPPTVAKTPKWHTRTRKRVALDESGDEDNSQQQQQQSPVCDGNRQAKRSKTSAL